MAVEAPATPAAPLTDEQAEVASTFQASSPDGKQSGAAVPAADGASSSVAGKVRQLPASAEYLPTDEQTADIAFLAMGTQASRNEELVAAIDGGQYINVADIRGNTIMHLILERGGGQVGGLPRGRYLLPESNSLTLDPDPESVLALTTIGPRTLPLTRRTL